jgi:hypothetical protein
VFSRKIQIIKEITKDLTLDWFFFLIGQPSFPGMVRAIE